MNEISLTENQRIFCSTCRNETNHDLKAEHHNYFSDDADKISDAIAYRFWVCAGCQQGILELAHVVRTTANSQDEVVSL